jgi:outer membrane usher protein FimD/PapC
MNLFWHRAGVMAVVLMLPFSIATPSKCWAREYLVLEVILNTEKKGALFVYLTKDGDCLMREDDLVAIGFRDPAGTALPIGGKTFISMRSMKDVKYYFDDETVSLHITAKPHLLRKSSIDLRPARRLDVYYPKDTGAFFNYGLYYASRQPPGDRYFTGTTQVGVRMGDLLFLGDSSYTRSDGDERFVRLSTNVTHESRLNLNRTVFGDLYATSGYLGNTVNMGGISFSRNFSIDPYFVKQPMVDYKGFATLPSEIRVSMDGAQIRSEKIGPGPFDLRNILSFNGVHDLEITVRDAFGREETVRYPFYSADTLLRSGLHEFSYNAGFLRRNYGTESNDYGRFAASFFHNYGLTDSLTIGARGEGLSDHVNMGPRVSCLMGHYGILSFGAGVGLSRGNSAGYAASLGYTYQPRNASFRILYNRYTGEYSTISTQTGDDKTQSELGAGIGYGTPRLGSISFDFAAIGKYTAANSERYTLRYSRGITRDANAYFSVTHTKNDCSDTRFDLGLTFHPGKDVTLSASFQKDDGSNYQTVQVQKSTPVGEGYGYRVTASRTGTSGSETSSINPFVQYNGTYGTYSAEFRGDCGTGSVDFRQSMAINAAGSVAYVGRTLSFGRPVSDSYGVVKVGDLEGVGVYHNNHLVGRTDRSGRLFLPNMISYADNYVSIDDRDIPIEYSLEKVGKYISPPYRSGTFLTFDAVKTRAVTGRMETRPGGRSLPVALGHATFRLNGKEISFITGRKGEFYLENIPTGRYTGTLRDARRTYSFTLVIPPSDDMTADLGGIIAEDSH